MEFARYSINKIDILINFTIYISDKINCLKQVRNELF